MEVSDWLIENTPELKIDLIPRSVSCARGLQFASRYAGNPEQDHVFDYLPESVLNRIANLDDFPRVLVFDKWTGNTMEDRRYSYKGHPGALIKLCS